MEFDSLNGDSKVKYSAIDSLLCKYSSSSLNYFSLPYLKNIYCKLNNYDGRFKLNHTVIRKSPIIHRGYYVRHHSFTTVLSQFINLTRSPPVGDKNDTENNDNVTCNINDDSSNTSNKDNIGSDGNSYNTTISQIIYLGKREY